MLQSLKSMHKDGGINDAQYIMMVSAVRQQAESRCDIDLLLKKSRLPLDISENIAFSLLNTSRIPM